MTQYDAGPGDYSDREWEAPDYESQPPRSATACSAALGSAAAVAALVVILVSAVMIANAVAKQ
jgi:hypothetical protein